MTTGSEPGAERARVLCVETTLLCIQSEINAYTKRYDQYLAHRASD